MFPTNPENASVIEGLYVRLTAAPIGEPVSYATLSEIAGRDVSGPARHLLDAAREKAEKELGCIFETVRTVGVKRLTSDATPEIGLTAIGRVRRAAKRGARRLLRINSNSLSDSQHKRVISYGAILGAIAMVADGNKARTVAAVADTSKPIPPRNILQMFMEKV